MERNAMMSELFIEERLRTPVGYECDVVIAGGGTAGVVAALAAARNGAKTILVDRYGFLGGTMLNGAGPLHSFFNLYKAFPGVEKVQVIRGIPQEIIDRLVAAGGSPGHLEQDKGGTYDSVITLVDWEIFKGVAFDMLEEAGVRILLHVMAVGTVMEGSTVKGIIIEGKSGREAILAKAVIDTTGDGDVAAKAGAAFIKQHGTTRVGMPFGMTNVDMPRLVRFLEEHDMVTQLIHAD
jgi:flavin-dependent dehydrogenase